MPRGWSNIDRRRSSELIALGAAAALGALAVWLLVRLVWLLVPRSDAALETAARLGGEANGGPAPAQSVAKWHLFGNTPLRPGAGPGAPATTLSMILRGTLADRNPGAGIAVINDGERGERVYRVGETIGSNVKLSAVYPDHVVLLHEGVEETLKLTRDQNLAPTDIVRPGQKLPQQNASANTPASMAAASAAQRNATDTRASAELKETIERLRQNPEELAKRVQIVPVLDGGKMTGVRVSSGTDTALMAQIGLRPGDVVVAVNGAPVDSLGRGQQIIENLRKSASARVTVMRDNKPTEITISLQ